MSHPYQSRKALEEVKKRLEKSTTWHMRLEKSMTTRGNTMLPLPMWSRTKRMATHSRNRLQLLNSIEASAPRRLFGRTCHLQMSMWRIQWPSASGSNEATFGAIFPAFWIPWNRKELLGTYKFPPLWLQCWWGQFSLA
ncbi:hypothetical protein KC19_VG060200 [Ceratodon purpureus]|uniref:Uncharacterized protein n=1 Tax=Ceratodon purpureus TaxID=3225 RepID=A0A8T0HME8_CERPU|nr:hypothetical protein KC19_VG060200 [Ceratodon purpureus]